jgi:short/branched chain acyl-CoA dehydrogenase
MSKTIYENDRHEELRQKVRAFAEGEVQPVAAGLDEREEFSVDLTRQMGQLGLFGINLPEKYGGHNKDMLSYIIAVEEIARVDSSQAATLAAHNSLGIYPIYRFGTEEQKMKFLPGLTTGKQLWSFGLTEKNAGSDARGTETTAVVDGNDWVINGTKQYITSGSTPVSAGVTLQVVTGEKDGKKELTTILVERDRGYETEKMNGKLMWRAADTARLKFSNIRVPLENLLGEKGKGAKHMFETLDGGRLSIAAIGLGLAEGAFRYALEHAGSRVQFGKPIGKNQGISFKIADMDLKIELARNLLYKACWMKDQGMPYSREAAMAKLYCSEVARDVADDAVQIFGGSGLFKSGPVERFYRDQRLLQIGEGTSEILRIVIARHLGL